MTARLLLLLFLCLGAGGCAETGHFVSDSDEALSDAEVVVQNQSDRAVVLELEDAANAVQKLEVGAKSEGRTAIQAGVYRYQLMISSKEPYERRWFSHGPKGKLEASLGKRYTWTWISAGEESP